MRQVADESAAYYQERLTMAVAALLMVPKGTLIKRRNYFYLRRYQDGGRKDVYIGPEHALPPDFMRAMADRPQLKRAKREYAETLRVLGRRDVLAENKDFPGILKDVWSLLGEMGLWKEGLVLVGSWCFNVYQHYFDVEFFPFTTRDVDLGLRMPLDDKARRLVQKLKLLGFRENYLERGEITLEMTLPSGDVLLEFLSAASEDGKPMAQSENFVPVAMRHLDLLLDNTAEVKIRGIDTVIVVPSMRAFFIHKLLTAYVGEHRILGGGKELRDYRQASCVAKRLLQEKDLIEDARVLFRQLEKGLQEEIKESVDYLETIKSFSDSDKKPCRALYNKLAG